MSIDELLEREGRAAEDNPGAELRPGTKITRGHSRSRTLQVRLNDDEYTALEAMAEARELPLSTMVRSMLIQASRRADSFKGSPEELRDLVEDFAGKVAAVAIGMSGEPDLAKGKRAG